MGISTLMTTMAVVGAASEIVGDLNEYLSATSNLLDSTGSEGQVRGELWWGPDDTEKSYKKLKTAQTWHAGESLREEEFPFNVSREEAFIIHTMPGERLP